MSLTKSSPAFDRMMEEARLQEECSYELYAEELYLNHRKGLGVPAEDSGRSTAAISPLRSEDLRLRPNANNK